jgi:hypothetical protein
MTEIILPGPSDISELMDEYLTSAFRNKSVEIGYDELGDFANDLLDLVLKYNNAFQNHKVRGES